MPESPTAPDTRTAAAQQSDQYDIQRLAAAAAAKAKRLWPDVIGEVLADEVMALLDLPAWLRAQTRTQRLISAILSFPEQLPQGSRGDRAA
jgi:hypothetical protein